MEFSLFLTETERRLILDRTFAPPELTDRLRRAPAEQTRFSFTADELDELVGYVAAEANHARSPTAVARLDRIYGKIESLLDREEEVLRPKPAPQRKCRGSLAAYGEAPSSNSRTVDSTVAAAVSPT